ncbi:xanthine dehydrogenase family protein molybdopterin-binding subunit [Telmatospirillum sp. J64-1]|uniref:xanthine dehydrogenase family protein molybdopterin-binding subunit n=1 Tax=Telmatospirillum sp. J64-1 TaxID=2502183 RepID=UPI00115F0C89|nr:xanthine dehydrogenase family protein molybdopterin-binding subunit [Telmatospirillum sp. J64-1]
MGRFGAGQPIRRVEDRRFLTGQGTYTDDRSLPNQAHMVVVRSVYAHARIEAIALEAARAMPGVIDIFTCADLDADGIGDVPTIFLPQNRDGSRMTAPRRRPLAQGVVRHVGEAVAIVIAETQAQARDAAELVQVDYDPLPAVAEAMDALEAGAPAVHDSHPDNLIVDWEMGDEAAVAEAFQSAARIVSLDLINNRVAPIAMEPRAALGQWDEAEDRFTLYTGSQGSHSLRTWLCRHVFGIPEEKMRVVAGDVGGGFGMRIFLFPEHALVLYAARKLGRPVKWVGDRSEAFLTDTHGRDHHSHARLALDEDGHFLALKVETVANLGAYVSQMGAFIPTLGGSGMLSGVYRTPHLHVHVRCALTNTAPVDAYRGAGRPEAAYLIERLVDAAARETGLAPDEIRRRNFIAPEQMPFTTSGGKTYDSGDFARLMDQAMARADWSGFPARREQSAKNGRLRGIGLAYYIEACGGGGPETARIMLSPEGDATVLIGTQSTGQGHETAYAQMVADGLSLPLSRIKVHQGDTDVVATGSGTGGSRSIPVGGAALAQAIEAVQAKAKRLAAHLLQAPEEDLSFADGRFTLPGSERSITLDELARASRDPDHLPEGMTPCLDATESFKPAAGTYPNGCHICEVEVDPETGETSILRYTIVDDFGVVLNPLLLQGQVHGGTVQGIGQALWEMAAYDPESGQLLAGSFMDYAVPRADFLPRIDSATDESIPCRTHPLGVKGAGEAGTIGAAPAVINAVVDALSPLGIRHVDMPATPHRVWKAIQQQRAGRFGT